VKPHQIIITIGVLLFTGLLVFAMLPDDWWDHDVPNVSRAQIPQLNTAKSPHHMARNNTIPPLNKVLNTPVAPEQGSFNSVISPAGEGAVNGGLNLNTLMQPVVGQATDTQTTQQFQFASKTNNNMTAVALTETTRQAGASQFATRDGAASSALDIRQGPDILSDAVPPASHQDGRNVRSCSLCHVVTRSTMANKERMTNNKSPFSPVAVRYSGFVLRVNHQINQTGWNRVHIWIRSQNGTTSEIITSPQWFLDFMGCKIGQNIMVEGVAFEPQDSAGTRKLLYAKNIIVDGQLYRIRSDNGLPLWSN